jgi:acetyl esterase/lipase
MARLKKQWNPDYTNTDPFRGLPPSFPVMRSRYPSVPSERFGEIPAVSEPTDDASKIEEALKKAKVPATTKRTWRDVARRIEAARKRRSKT